MTKKEIFGANQRDQSWKNMFKNGIIILYIQKINKKIQSFILYYL